MADEFIVTTEQETARLVIVNRAHIISVRPVRDMMTGRGRTIARIQLADGQPGITSADQFDDWVEWLTARVPPRRDPEHGARRRDDSS